MKIPPFAKLDLLPPFAIGRKITASTNRQYVITDIIQTYQEHEETGEPHMSFVIILEEIQSGEYN